MHSFVERQLVARVGDAGRRLHTGRSRNEQVSVDLRLYLRRRIPLLQQKLRATIAAFADQAEQAGDALMPSYTHMRRAMPVLVSHFLLSHAAALRRDHARLEAAREEAERAAARLRRDRRHRLRDRHRVPRRHARLRARRANSMDASSDRDFAASFLHAVSLSMVHLSRIAEDFILMTGEEFGFFELADSSATGSSMMPQKKNPDPLELVRGKAGRAIGHLTGFLVTMKGLPTGYNKDLQEDKEPLFDAEDTLAVSLDATAAVIGKLTLHPDRTGRAASGLLLATDVADYLVSRGMPFRQAHEVVGAMVRRLLQEKRDFESLSLRRMAAIERVVWGRRQGARHGGGVGQGQKNPAIDPSRRGGRGACRNPGLACPGHGRLIYSGCPAPYGLSTESASRTQYRPSAVRAFAARGSRLEAEED